MPRKKVVVPTHCEHQDKRGLCHACSIEKARNPLVDWLLEQKPAPYKRKTTKTATPEPNRQVGSA